MTAHISTVAFFGIEARLVDVQVRMMSGAVAFMVVGLPDKMVAESRERVRGALSAIGLSLPPKHITVNLAGREIGDSIHISMITLPDGVRPVIADRDFTIATVAAPTVQTEEEVRPTAAAEAAPAERKAVPAAPGGAAAPKAAAPAAKAPAKK